MERWINQEEAYKFAMEHPAVMLDMEMGTGKTRVALDVSMDRQDVHKILVVCPKAVIPVWRENLMKFYGDKQDLWDLVELNATGTTKKNEQLRAFMKSARADKKFVIVNYDSIWRSPLGDTVLTAHFDEVILDESHRAKAAGSKVSRFLAFLGRKTPYKLCLSGTPMANSPLDVYGQYRFLDPSIFGTNHSKFLQEFAIFGGPEYKFIVGFRNLQELNRKFRKIAYTCKMSDVSQRLKLPDVLPDVRYSVQLPAKDITMTKKLSKDFIAECSDSAHIVVKNVLGKILRLQQIAAGFCLAEEDLQNNQIIMELNHAKEDALVDLFSDLGLGARVVVFGVFTHDLDTIHKAARKAGRRSAEISGRVNELDEWKKEAGSVLAVQIQAGAEGIDLSSSHYAVYFSLPHSLALYHQSRARLYRPGQKQAVSFIHLIAEHTIDEAMYKSLQKKEDIIDAVKTGRFDFGYVK